MKNSINAIWGVPIPPNPPKDRIFKNNSLMLPYREAKFLYNRKCLRVYLWKLSKAVFKFKTELSRTLFIRKFIIPVLNYLS